MIQKENCIGHNNRKAPKQIENLLEALIRQFKKVMNSLMSRKKNGISRADVYKRHTAAVNCLIA